MRNIEDELRSFGLDENQVNEIMLWTERLPIEIHTGITNTKVEIIWGKVIVSQNDHMSL